MGFNYIPWLIALIIFPIYLINVTPGYTWASAGVDHFDFIFAANNWFVPHSTGFPLYNIFAAILVHIFADSHPAWIMALFLSTIPTIITGINIYFITDNLKKSKGNLIPIMAMLMFLASPPILAQTFIVEVYTFSMMMLTFTLLFHVRKQYWIASIFMGLTLGTHGLMITMMFFLGLLWFKQYIYKLPIILIIAITLYASIPIMFNNIDDPIFITTLRGNTFQDFYAFVTLGSSIFWWGTLPIWQIPERLADTAILLVTGFGIGAFTLLLHIRYDLKQYWKYWLIAGTTLYYWLTVTVQITHVHFALAIPILAIMAALGIKHLHPRLKNGFILFPTILALIAIPGLWEIGQDIDKDLDAQIFYESLFTIDELPGNDIFLNMTLLNQGYKHDGKLTDGTAIWWAILNYRKETGSRNITPIFPDRYTSLAPHGSIKQAALTYRNILKNDNINTPHTSLQWDEIENSWYINWNNNIDQRIIIEDNDNLRLNSTPEDFWLPEIVQLQLWLTIDLITASNPEHVIWYMERTGLQETKNTPIRYNHLQMPIEIQNEISRIYTEAAKFTES